MRVMTADTADLTVSAAEAPNAETRLTALFDEHHQRLYRLARRLSRTADEARDLVQETFLRAAQKLASVPPGAAREEAWLVRVLVNLCRDRWRQRAARQRLQRQNLSALTVTPSGEAALVARTTIWKGLQLLSPRRRAVLVMCELEGFSIQAVARTLALNPVTVRWHLSRGRRELARVIAYGGQTHRDRSS